MYQSKRCAFLGYNFNYRGYRSYESHFKKAINNRHVVVDETNFPGRISLHLYQMCLQQLLLLRLQQLLLSQDKYHLLF